MYSMYLMALVGAPINANAMGDPTRYNLFFSDQRTGSQLVQLSTRTLKGIGGSDPERFFPDRRL